MTPPRTRRSAPAANAIPAPAAAPADTALVAGAGATTALAEAPTSAELADDLRVAVARANRRLRRERSSDEITDPQYSVLAALDRHGPSTPTELAEHENVRPPSMTRTVGCLVDAGLVTRQLDPDDGRRAIIAISPAGARHVAETRRRRDAWLASRLDELDAEQREVLARAAALLVGLADR